MTRAIGQGNRVTNHLSAGDIPKPAFICCRGRWDHPERGSGSLSA